MWDEIEFTLWEGETPLSEWMDRASIVVHRNIQAHLLWRIGRVAIHLNMDEFSSDGLVIHSEYGHGSGLAIDISSPYPKTVEGEIPYIFTDNGLEGEGTCSFSYTISAHQREYKGVDRIFSMTYLPFVDYRVDCTDPQFLSDFAGQLGRRSAVFSGL